MCKYYPKLKKAIIPIAGLGTRMLPVTKAIPKEMLPLVDKPLIQLVVHECTSAGINDIIFITHSSKHAISNHFDTNFELEAMLEKRVKHQLLKEIQSICPPLVTIMQVRQGISKGLGHAIMCAYPLVGKEPVAILLPDVIIDEYKSDLTKENLAEMLIRYQESGHSQILVAPVQNVTAYGMINYHSKQKLNPGDSAAIINVIEKPKIWTLPSNLAIVGRYIFSGGIWECLATALPSNNGEIQLTDSIAMLIKKETVQAYHLKGISYDCGNKLGYMQAFFKYSLNHPILGNDFKYWLNQTLQEK